MMCISGLQCGSLGRKNTLRGLLRGLIAVFMLASGMAKASTALEFKVDLIQLEPWALVNPSPVGSGPHVGIVLDLLNEFEKRSGYLTRKTLTPYIRVEYNLERGDSDFSIMAWGDARAAYANKGTAFVPLEFGVRARQGVKIRQYDDLKSITTSATRGLKIDPRFDADTMLKKDMVVDYTTGVKKTVARHGSDAVAGSLSTINYIIRRLGVTAEFGETYVFRTTYLTVAFSKKSPLIGYESQVNAIFQTMVDDGTAKKIYDKWMHAY